MINKGTIYCPICQDFIIATNKDQVDNGFDDNYIFVHKEIEHTEEDLSALYNGVQ
jgi:hypothetical protein